MGKAFHPVASMKPVPEDFSVVAEASNGDLGDDGGSAVSRGPGTPVKSTSSAGAEAHVLVGVLRKGKGGGKGVRRTSQPRAPAIRWNAPPI